MEYNQAFFKDMVCAVTGGASGIGLALCEELLDSGAKRVVLADFNRDTLTEQVKRLELQYSGRVKGVYCNVTVEDDVKRMVDESAAFGEGRLNLLINCAGAAFPAKFSEEPEGLIPGDTFRSRLAADKDWSNGFALNYFGAVYGCRAAMKYMLPQRGGYVVNIVSGIAFSPMAYQSIYAATKAALSTFTFSLRYEFWDYGVRFIAATPGTTATAIFKDIPGGAPKEAQSPRQSAQRILHGITSNERMIMGDDSDVTGGKNNFNPLACAELDSIFAAFAKMRRSGGLSFTLDETSGCEPVPDEPRQKAVPAEFLTAASARKMELLRDYLAELPAPEIKKAYFEGKNAVVTGGASGVGLALCGKLLECGVKKVVLADVNSENLLKQTRELDARYPGRVKGVLCDVSKEEDVKAMIAEAQTSFDGSFDILINCAGVAQRGMFVKAPDDEANAGMIVEQQDAWDRVFGVNFYGPLYGCRAALPIMIAQGSGQIVNIISGMAYIPMPFEGIYASSKAALNLLTLTLRYEYWGTGVIFNSATPGVAATPIFDGIKVPDIAQSPESAAIRILSGVSRNDRIICGDDRDFETLMFVFDIDLNQYWDNRLKDVARIRREGHAEYYGI